MYFVAFEVSSCTELFMTSPVLVLVLLGRCHIDTTGVQLLEWSIGAPGGRCPLCHWSAVGRFEQGC